MTASPETPEHDRKVEILRMRYLAAWRLGDTHRAMELYEELRRLEREATRTG
ncbi:hypothetical protein [Streptomyces sp. NPDC002537]